jgi:hypothetical protein
MLHFNIALQFLEFSNEALLLKTFINNLPFIFVAFPFTKYCSLSRFCYLSLIAH